jgi:UDP-N-acetylglucosamine 3-dehydrogenase
MSNCFAVIGTGYWGKNHVRVFKELLMESVIKELKICDLDEKKAKEVGETFGVKWTTDYGDLLNDQSVRAVSIVTPSSTHFKIAKEFLEHGKDVLVEKPITLNSKEAVELEKRGEENSCIFMAGHIFRYHPAIRELKVRMVRRELGKPYFMLGTRFDAGVPRKDMGVLYASGIHEVDIFCFLLDVDHCYAMVSWLVQVYGKRRELIVIGSEKSVRINYLKPSELELFDVRISKRLKEGEEKI